VPERTESPADVARALGVSTWTVRRWMRTRKIPYTKLGGRYYLSSEEVRDHMTTEHEP
jgi:excisionase family DNA binding protein